MSQVNHNAAYATVIDGYTPIERLRVTRNFLHDRNHAKRISEIGIMKLKKQMAEMKDTLDETDEIAVMEYQLKEFELEQALDLHQDCLNELVFLENMEQALIEMSAHFWDDTISDKENYERNFAMEQSLRLCAKAEADIGAYGRFGADTLLSLQRDPFAADMLGKKGVINADGVKALMNASIVTATNIGIISRAGGLFLPAGGYAALLDIINTHGGNEVKLLLPSGTVEPTDTTAVDTAPVTGDAAATDTPVTDTTATVADATATTDAPATDTTTPVAVPTAPVDAPDVPVTTDAPVVDTTAPVADNAATVDTSATDTTTTDVAPVADTTAPADAPVAATTTPVADATTTTDAPAAVTTVTTDASVADTTATADAPATDTTAPVADTTATADATATDTTASVTDTATPVEPTATDTTTTSTQQ